MRRLLLSLCCCSLLACGVKVPPIAPERPPESVPLKLDCSPKDPDCDRTDPNYKPKSR